MFLFGIVDREPRFWQRGCSWGQLVHHGVKLLSKQESAGWRDTGKEFHPPRDGGGEEGGPSEGAPEGRGESEPGSSVWRGCRPGALMEQTVPSVGSMGTGGQLKSVSAWWWTEGFMLCLQVLLMS